jgi:DNA repair protein RadD
VTTLTLRDYQREAIDAAYAWHATHDGACLLEVPTGGGKSLILGTIAAEAASSGASVLILAHRKELLEQNWRACQHAGLSPHDVGLISGQLNRKDRDRPVTVASIQTLANRPHSYGSWNLILIDECHLVSAGDNTRYQKVLRAARTMTPDVRIIGLTATPYRLGSGRLDEGDDALFHGTAYRVDLARLLEAGHLCPLISKATLSAIDTRGLATRGGEFVESALHQRCDDPALITAIVDELCTLGADRAKWLVFCAGVGHAQHMAEALTASGIPTAAVHGDLPADERRAALDGLKSGRLRALTNCDVLTTGYDEPAISLIAMCRPTLSTGLYVQMIGRGFRTHPSKTNTLVLDFAGNCLQHGPVDQVQIRPARKKGESTSVVAPRGKACPQCQEIIAASARLCPACQHAFPPPAPPQLVPRAFASPVLSTEAQHPVWHDVTHVEYSRHEPREATKKATLRVDYFYHFQRVAAEWICLEHSGFAREKASTWWAQRTDVPCPRTIDEALDVTEQLEVPQAISTIPDGKYRRVDRARFAHTPAAVSALPRACWSCGHWADTCTKWDDIPPDDVQRTGCDAWTDEDLIPF